MTTANCHISGQSYAINKLLKGENINPNIFQLIKKDFPDFTEDSFISFEKYNEYRRRYLHNLVEMEVGTISGIETEVINSIANNDLISAGWQDENPKEISFGDKMADRIADFGGSWTFIISFFVFILIWMVTNSVLFFANPIDPYPFILLNLILSCLAAIQAPIIMMSQNRKEDRDRQRSINDYKVNLKAELEIRLIHEKIDHLIQNQNRKLLEIQDIQADYLEDILKTLNKKQT